MLIKCKNNQLVSLPEKLHEFALSQDEAGLLDITPGKTYPVYGIRENNLGRFYLTMTDTQYFTTPWWMPAALYDVVDDKVPSSWTKVTDHGYFGKFTVLAPAIYHEHEVDIEDGTPVGHEVFDKMQKEA
jgi:hypothetical protein